MPTVITFSNLKGGVGKTTGAIAVGDGLARIGYKVLLIDLDPQGHVAYSLGKERQPGVQRVLFENIPVKEVAIKIRPNLDVIASNKAMGGDVELQFNRLYRREESFERSFIDKHYDVIIFDTAPSFNTLHVTTLGASDWVIIPTKLDALAVDGVSEVLRSILAVGKGRIEFSVLPTFYDQTTTETYLQLADIVKNFGDKVWPPIPSDTKIREAVSYRKTIWDYCRNSPGVIGFFPKEQNKGNRVGGFQSTLFRVNKEILGNEKRFDPVLLA